MNPNRHVGWRLFLPGITTSIEWFFDAGLPRETTNSFRGSSFDLCRSFTSNGVVIVSPTMGTMPAWPNLLLNKLSWGCTLVSSNMGDVVGHRVLAKEFIACSTLWRL